MAEILAAGPLGGLPPDIFAVIWQSLKDWERTEKRSLLAVDKATYAGGCGLIDGATIDLSGPAWLQSMEAAAMQAKTSLPSVVLKRLKIDAMKSNVPSPGFLIPGFLFHTRGRLEHLQELSIQRSNVSD